MKKVEFPLLDLIILGMMNLYLEVLKENPDIIVIRNRRSMLLLDGWKV